MKEDRISRNLMGHVGDLGHSVPTLIPEPDKHTAGPEPQSRTRVREASGAATHRPPQLSAGIS